MATHTLTPSGDVVLCFTPAEFRALHACAHEGAEGLLTDPAAARGFIGGPAAIRAAERAMATMIVASGDLHQRTLARTKADG